MLNLLSKSLVFVHGRQIHTYLKFYGFNTIPMSIAIDIDVTEQNKYGCLMNT